MSSFYVNWFPFDKKYKTKLWACKRWKKHFCAKNSCKMLVKLSPARWWWWWWWWWWWCPMTWGRCKQTETSFSTLTTSSRWSSSRQIETSSWKNKQKFIGIIRSKLSKFRGLTKLFRKCGDFQENLSGRSEKIAISIEISYVGYVNLVK